MRNMNRMMVMPLAVVAFLLSTFASGLQAADAVDAKTVAEHLDKSKYTSSEIKTYMKGLKGKQVAAAGKVDDILNQPKRTAKVVVLVSVGRKDYFIVDVHMPQDQAGALKKNDVVTCSGDFRRYNPWTLNGIVLVGSCRK